MAKRQAPEPENGRRVDGWTPGPIRAEHETAPHGEKADRITAAVCAFYGASENNRMDALKYVQTLKAWKRQEQIDAQEAYEILTGQTPVNTILQRHME
jgi:hypothetical protein